MSELTIKGETSTKLTIESIDPDGEVCISIYRYEWNCMYIDKQDAIAIIQHLQKQFNIYDMKEHILCDALHYDDDNNYPDQPDNIQWGFVVTGRRHSDCYNTIQILTGNDELGNKIGRKHPGFLTNTNRYVSREEGWRIAIKANQVVYGPTDSDENSILISENLF